jgi:DNA-binding PadR family transcriptional regulator
MDETTSLHVQELRRGTVVLACLVRLTTPEYGYALLETLSELGFSVDAGTLYPLLRRLEKQGLLSSAWNTDEARPRKFYTTSALGHELAASLTTEWHAIDESLRALKTREPKTQSPKEGN